MHAFFEWVNSKKIAPWVLAIVGAVWAFARLEATTVAQVEHITELREQMQTRDREYHDTMADTLKVLVHSVEEIKDEMRDMSTDVSLVCEKVRGRCRSH